MSGDVRGVEFTEEDLERFSAQVRELKWDEAEPTSEAIRREAEAFARSNPRPDLETLRSHVDHSVAAARGRDHPDDRALMLDSAVEAYYILAWLEHLQEAANRRGDAHQIDLDLGVKITFTPVLAE